MPNLNSCYTRYMTNLKYPFPKSFCTIRFLVPLLSCHLIDSLTFLKIKFHRFVQSQIPLFSIIHNHSQRMVALSSALQKGGVAVPLGLQMVLAVTVVPDSSRTAIP